MSMTPEKLQNSLLGKLYDVLTMGDENVARDNRNFFSWMSIGMPCDEDQFDFLIQGFTASVRNTNTTTNDESATDEDQPSLAERMGAQTAELYMEAENLARLADFVPSVSGLDEGSRRHNIMPGIWSPQGTLSGAYEKALRMSQVIQTELGDKLEAKIKRLRGLLVTKKTKIDLITEEEIEVTEPSPMVKLYMEKMNAYEEAALDLSSARVSALSASSPEAVHYYTHNAKTLRRRVRAAYNDWVANGYKEDYERISAFISHVMQRDLTLLKEEYRSDLEDAKLTGISSGSDFYYTSLLPGNFARSKGWTRFSFTQKDFASHYDREKKNWGASASYFGIGRASVEGRNDKLTSEVDWSSMELSFEIAQIPIVRAWFREEFLKSHYWRFSPQDVEHGKADKLSDGKMPPTGDLVSYPTTMIFVRNLRLKFNTYSGKYEQFSEALKAKGGLRIGPFRAGGKYGKEGEERDHEYRLTKEGIEIPGMQLIGFRCHLLPQSPDPIEDIKDDLWV